VKRGVQRPSESVTTVVFAKTRDGRFKVLRFAFLGGKRFEVQGSTSEDNFFKV
jgi:hypothetical protein